MGRVADFRAVLEIFNTKEARWNGLTDLGTPVIVTYSFADGDNVPSISNSAHSVTETSAFTSAQRQNFREAVALFEAAAGVLLVEVDEDGMIDVSNADGSSYGGWANFAYSTKDKTGAGEGILVIDAPGKYDQGSRAFQTIIHELGHALGLQHPHSGRFVLEDSVNTQDNTIMTYNRSKNSAVELGVFDIEALQYLYGSAVDTSGWTITAEETPFYTNRNLVADQGKNIIIGVNGFIHIDGAAGADTLIGREYGDDLYGSAGRDLLLGMAGDDRLFGGNNNDVIYGDFLKPRSQGSGDDRLFGGKGSDILYAGRGHDTVEGGGGEDIIYGGDGEDYLRGGHQSDTLFGRADSDTLSGGIGDDVLFGGKDTDWLYGWYGDDILYGGADKISSPGDRERLFGGGGDDQLFGGGQSASLYGDNGHDILLGGNGSEKIFGGNGRDILDGGKGRDVLEGGTHADVFIFKKGYEKDTIVDFEDDKDTVSFATDLWFGTKTVQNVINRFATVVDGDIVFDFGNHELTIKGFTNLADLKDDITFI